MESKPSLSELFSQATQAHQANQLQQAEQLYRQVLTLAPEHAEAHHLLGLVCSQQERHAEAVISIQQAITLVGDNPTYYHNLGEVWRRQERLEQAVNSYRQALALDPDFTQAHFSLANLLKTQGALEEAIHHYRRAIELAPNHAKAHNNLGNILLEQGQLESAIGCYQQAVRLDPNFINARRNLFLALQQQSRHAVPAGDALERPRRIGFFVPYPFQHAMVDPIYNELKDDLPCLMSSDTQEMVEYRPDILVLAEHHQAFFRRYLPETIIVWTRHGFASKQYTQKSLEWCDFACISSEWVRDDLANRGWFPRLGFWITGFSAMDKLLGESATAAKPPGLENMEPGPTLLYATTWNPEQSAIEVLGPDWIGSLRAQFPQLNIIIKLHPHIPRKYPHWLEMHRQMAQHDPRIHLVESPEANSYDYMPFADILLTDVSSVMFYYLAFDRPIILVNNPRRFENEAWFDQTGPEWAWRDMGWEIETLEQLPAAIEAALQHPQEKAEQRALYRQRVFGNLTDGQSTARIAAKVRALAQPTAGDEAWVDLAWNSIRALGQFQRLLNHMLENDDHPLYPSH